MSATTLLLVLDLVGIAVFGVSGALTGVGKSLDLFGVLFLSVATALGGGFLRDALIGATPAAALTDGRYLVVPVVVGLIVFYVHPVMSRLSRMLLLVDAAGLGLFAVAGTRKALDFGVPAVGACGIGLLTAIGGGLIRDVLVRGGRQGRSQQCGNGRCGNCVCFPSSCHQPLEAMVRAIAPRRRLEPSHAPTDQLQRHFLSPYWEWFSLSVR
jgi:hypothetical protein